MILRHREKEEPLAGVYDRDLADEMLAEIRERKGSVFAFLNRIGYDICESTAPEESFANINRPEDYHGKLYKKLVISNRYVLRKQDDCTKMTKNVTEK